MTGNTLPKEERFPIFGEDIALVRSRFAFQLFDQLGRGFWVNEEVNFRLNLLYRFIFTALTTRPVISYLGEIILLKEVTSLRYFFLSRWWTFTTCLE